MPRKPIVPRKDVSKSTSYAHQRYAHPFFLPAQQADREPTKGGQKNMTEWSKTRFGPVPKVAHDGLIDLATIIGTDGVQEIEQLGEIRFHAVGDSGSGHADDAEKVADDMATDYKPDAGALNPAFLFHLGDVVYGPDKDSHYGERFYRPYRHYPGKIIAIPGNPRWRGEDARRHALVEGFSGQFLRGQGGRSAAGRRQRHLPRNHDAAGRVLASRHALLAHHRLVFKPPGKPGISRRQWRQRQIAIGVADENAQVDREQR